ncbi:2-C-methyl-D-erythritol 4-phosphate cytidylyltransferase [Herbiconiux sp. L3-i23]|uniref:2-C-methyl-D-erythritol 4-phosphate cytidylyltransferase n=1 Tax=Herbiconiux sp. L3-i23 TaxID=2905871 RepID=UPI002045962B|nr:2-C-methyl-D-erythritol 4-phosphate cytidylyltransferase [Herbiconiux sp. L3-i23]BDI23739.1 bifunctional enzyme IspD/IspF [Herbiconiux sp. L3-i23]
MTLALGSPDAVVIVAAGEGTRLGYGLPKAFVPVAGSTMLQRAFDTVAAAERAFEAVLVVPGDLVERVGVMIGAVPAVRVVAGGASRHESVRRGLGVLSPNTRRVLVHDAARALTPASLIDAVVDAVELTGNGVVPALPVVDTVKRVDEERVLETVDRSSLAAVQTPQGFPFAELRAAYDSVESEHTDDTAVFAAAGHTVITVPGSPAAFKITTADDLVRAERMLAGEASLRTGIGVDVHAFGDTRELRLAGLVWPDYPALDGHSDGDAVAHAICDALLSAAKLGDIGGRFGTSDPRYSGAAGEVFLSATLSLLRENGIEPVNVAVQIIGARPRFSARRLDAEQLLAEILGVPVSLAATTSDGLGFTGRDEGVAVLATALVRAVGARAQ